MHNISKGNITDFNKNKEIFDLKTITSYSEMFFYGK